MEEYDWKTVIGLMGGKLIEVKKDVVRAFINGDTYDFGENGGEINISVIKVVGNSVPYWSNAHLGGSVGPITLAARLTAEIAGRPIDYDMDLDKDLDALHSKVMGKRT
jgi:hypothetical protein